MITAEPRITSFMAGNRPTLQPWVLFIAIASCVTDILYDISVSYKIATVKCLERDFSTGGRPAICYARGPGITYGEWLLKAGLLRLAAFGGGLAKTGVVISLGCYHI